MVQEFHVLRCFSCESFQVQQVKKANRWSCKMCGEKQSLLKEFGRGSGADCRRHVQKLNATRGAAMERQEDDAWSLWEEEEEAAGEEEAEQEADDQVGQTQVSRWNRYLSAPEEAEPEEDGVLMDRDHLHGNNMTDRKKKKRTDTRHREPTPAQSQSSASSLRRKPVGPSTTGPTQSGPTRSGPIRPGPTQSGPTQSGPIQSGTIRSSSIRSGPTQSGPTRSSPIQSGPSQSGPTRSGPTQSGLIQSGPTRSGPIRSGPTLSGPPSKKRATGPFSKWTQFLSSAREEQEGAGLPVSGAASPSNQLSRPRPLPTSPSNQVIRPRPPLPGSSLFETGEEFSFEDLNQ